MKFTITVECEDDFEKDAILNCVKNKLLLDGIYDEVFRKVIKYEQDVTKVEAFEMVWSELSKHLNGE